MIFVDRSKVPCPEALLMKRGTPAMREFDAAKFFFGDPVKHHIESRQRKFQFKAYKSPGVATALQELFHTKCAYCEIQYDWAAPTGIGFYRPRGGVVESPEHPGYWWLAMRWENLVLTCGDCDRVRQYDDAKYGKANRFPLLDENMRAFRPTEDLAREQPLILDPCDPNDKPENHLIFDAESGLVYSESSRGQATITILSLNRAALVERRRETANYVRSGLQEAERSIAELNMLHRQKAPLDRILGLQIETDVRIDSLLKRMNPDQEFAALNRQMIQPWMDRFKTTGDIAQSSPNKVSELLSEIRDRIAALEAQQDRAKIAQEQHEESLSSYSLLDKDGIDKFRGRPRKIERITVQNVKAIKDLDLNIKDRAWYMLLGENSTGKSTLLHTVTLALMDADSVARLGADKLFHPGDFVRHRCQSGTVSVYVSGFSKPFTLVFYPNRVDFSGPTGEKSISFRGSRITVGKTGTGWKPQMMILGYGATRLLPRDNFKPVKVKKSESFSRTDNLFDPFMPLIAAEKWLIKLSAKDFNRIAIVLKDLLALPPETVLRREDKQVVVGSKGNPTPLRQLSDGYKSMVALTVDILEMAHRLWGNPENAEGVILLDELGSHLHPRWKMKVVNSLRKKALPRMQFLVTTHDPLCLRGLTEGEVAVMRRDEKGNVIALRDLPSPADLRVDQLLTSPFFGLSSTADPDLEADFDEYYRLLSLTTPTDAEKTQIDALREKLKTHHRYLGETFRESLMYDAIDSILAEYKNDPVISLGKLRKSTIATVKKIWDEPLSTNVERQKK